MVGIFSLLRDTTSFPKGFYHQVPPSSACGAELTHTVVNIAIVSFSYFQSLTGCEVYFIIYLIFISMTTKDAECFFPWLVVTGYTLW